MWVIFHRPLTEQSTSRNDEIVVVIFTKKIANYQEMSFLVFRDK
jgi:hypothetical protein